MRGPERSLCTRSVKYAHPRNCLGLFGGKQSVHKYVRYSVSALQFLCGGCEGPRGKRGTPGQHRRGHWSRAASVTRPARDRRQQTKMPAHHSFQLSHHPTANDNAIVVPGHQTTQGLGTDNNTVSWEANLPPRGSGSIPQSFFSLLVSFLMSPGGHHASPFLPHSTPKNKIPAPVPSRCDINISFSHFASGPFGRWVLIRQ
jgi:hypothetical protein